MAQIECTPVSWVQEKAELHARENRAINYSAATRNRKENISELLCGLMIGTCFVCFLIIGLFIA